MCLQAFKASAALAEAAEAAAGASADKPPTEGNRTSTAKGARVQTLSPNYKMALREFQLVSGVSNNKTARAQYLCVLATMAEYGKHFGGEPVDADKLLQIIPTNLSSIVDDCHTYDDYLLSIKANTAFDAAFANHDAGHAGVYKQTYVSAVGYDHDRNCISEMSLGAERLAGGGKAIAECIIAMFGEHGIDCCGQATDNASDVSVTAANFLKANYLGFVAVGCSLHQLNLTLMNAYHSTFGFEEMGVPSALRVAYIVNYLMSLEGHLELWKSWAELHGYAAIAFKACGASKGRWWSVVQGFSDVYHHRVAYSAWCIYMASYLGTTSSTYQHIYIEAGQWLQNDKVICDLSFVLAFHEAWFNAEMLFCQGIGPWQAGIPEVDQKAGYRADEFVVHVVMARRRLLAISKQVGTHPKFERFNQHRAALDTTPLSDGEDSTQVFMDKQVIHFFFTALETLGNHHDRWLVPLVDCVIAYPVKEVALATIVVLLQIYDGKECDAALLAIDTATMVTVEGEVVNLHELVSEITQFITEAELHEDSVLFQDPQNVEDIRVWAANGGALFGDSGDRLS